MQFVLKHCSCTLTKVCVTASDKVYRLKFCDTFQGIVNVLFQFNVFHFFTVNFASCACAYMHAHTRLHYIIAYYITFCKEQIFFEGSFSLWQAGFLQQIIPIFTFFLHRVSKQKTRTALAQIRVLCVYIVFVNYFLCFLTKRSIISHQDTFSRQTATKFNQ